MINENKILKADRGLFAFILLNAITFGLYNLYFIHSVAKDINTTCFDDDRHTDGVVMFLILTTLTLGLYSFLWYCFAANRINHTFNKYYKGVCETSATNWICWSIFGSLLFGLGPLIAQYHFIHAVNDLNSAYNIRYNYNKGTNNE